MDHWNNLAEGWPDVLFALDHNTNIKTIEGNLTGLWKYEPVELIGIPFFRLFDKNVQDFLESFFKSGENTVIHKASALDKSGDTFPINVHIINFSGQFIAWVKRPSNNNKLNLDLLLPVVNHELKNPLNSIIGISNLLLQKAPREDQRELLQALKFSAENLQVLANDILDYANMETGNMKIENDDFDLRSLINSIQKSFLHLAISKGISFGVQVHDEVPEFVRGDSTRLSQILYNLVGNAFKFTDKGTINMEVSSEMEKSRHIMFFKVSDTGIGIGEDKINKIFLPFEQAGIEKKYGGMGLGLSIINTLVQLLKGKIKVESQLGKGSTFMVWLPFMKTRGKTPHPVPYRIKYQGLENIKLLYIEDLESNQLLMREYGALMGFKADFAISCQMGLIKLQENNYDIVLLDLNLPDEDGYAFAAKIRDTVNSGENIPIIAVTADRVAIEKLEVFGINDIIMKPVLPDELFNKLIKHINKDEKLLGVRKKMAGFDLFDPLYGDKPQEYKSLLYLMIQEYRHFKTTLLVALKNKDQKKFTEIVHGMRSNLSALGLIEFIDYLEKIKNQVGESGNQKKSRVITELSVLFNQLEDLLNGKINQLG
jgi:DNA-binding response OmpR family regulator/two-component sensor histidine kinase